VNFWDLDLAFLITEFSPSKEGRRKEKKKSKEKGKRKEGNRIKVQNQKPTAHICGSESVLIRAR